MPAWSSVHVGELFLSHLSFIFQRHSLQLKSASSPLPCPPGSFAPVAGTSSCWDCPDGSYNDRHGQTSCQRCPVGFYCSSGTKQPCSSSTIAPVEGMSACSSCPAGFLVNALNQSCDPCAMSDICNSNENRGQCGKGEYLDGDSCYYCGAGYYQTETGQRECLPCPIGHQCYDNSEPPVPCSPGTYQSTPAATSCSDTPAGHYNAGSGAETPQSWPAGTYQTDSGKVSCMVSLSWQPVQV